MKKFFSVFASLLLAGFTTLNVVGCISNKSSSINNDLTNKVNQELNKFHGANNKYIIMDVNGNDPNSEYFPDNPANNSDTLTKDVITAVYDDLNTNVFGFSKVINKSDIQVRQIKNTIYPDQYGTVTTAPYVYEVKIVKLNVDNKDVQVVDNMFMKLNDIINSNYTEVNPAKFSFNSIKLEYLLPSIYNIVKKGGTNPNPLAANWLENNDLNYFFDEFLNPAINLGKYIPTTMPLRNDDGTPVANDPWTNYLTKLNGWFKNNVNFDLKTMFDTSLSIPISKGKELSIPAYPTSVWDILDSIAPDLIHFHNFLLWKITQFNIKSLDFNDFVNLLLQYFFTDAPTTAPTSTSDHKDELYYYDRADKSEANLVPLAKNFDFLVFDLFDNWYLSDNKNSKPSYAFKKVSGSMQVTTALWTKNQNYLSYNKDYKTARFDDKRGLKMFLGFPQLSFDYASVPELLSDSPIKILEKIFNLLFQHNYNVLSSTTIALATFKKINFSLSFLHEFETEEWLSNNLEVMDTSTVFSDASLTSWKKSSFKILVNTSDKNGNVTGWKQINYLDYQDPGITGDDFLTNYLENPNILITGLRIVMVNPPQTDTIKLMNGVVITVNLGAGKINNFALAVDF